MATAPVDIPVQVKGLSDLQKLERRMDALEKEVTRLTKKLPAASNNVRKFGRASAYATKSVGGLGVAVSGVLGPIGLLVTVLLAWAAGVQRLLIRILQRPNLKALAVNADQLVTNLKAVSNELQGTASVAELTGAAYDVASAGFSSAAEASQVLKAASLGATGGFSRPQYGGECHDVCSERVWDLRIRLESWLMDFIQTQNDGKIVVANTPANIGKVASAAAGR